MGLKIYGIKKERHIEISGGVGWYPGAKHVRGNTGDVMVTSHSVSHIIELCPPFPSPVQHR